jgi:hypothetical protein
VARKIFTEVKKGRRFGRLVGVFVEAEKVRGKESMLAVESIGTLRSEFDWLRLVDIVLG